MLTVDSPCNLVVEPQAETEVAEDGAEEDHKVDWATIKVFVKSRPKTLDADAKLSEDDIFLIILEHTGEERARILANMAITVRKIFLTRSKVVAIFMIFLKIPLLGWF